MTQWTKCTAGAAAAIFMAAMLIPAYGLGQSAPTETGGGRKPYVTIILDTSASMQWTDKGDERYPERDYSALGVPSDPYPNQPDEYTPGMDLGIDGAQTGNPAAIGSCLVWEPLCTSYERPSWNPVDVGWTSAYGATMGTRLQTYMRGTTSDFNSAVGSTGSFSTDQVGYPLRMVNSSQPRHVTFKEIMTGEMVLRPQGSSLAVEDLNHRNYGPGCWLVPRQYGSNRRVCSGSTEFTQYPDYLDPRPHFQEVFDGQKPNGLLDSLAQEMYVSVTAFDGFQWPQTGSPQGSSADGDRLQTVDWDPNDLDDTVTGTFQGITEGNGNYNLGIYRTIGPTRFDVPNDMMPLLSDYVQRALVDMGTLKRAADPNSSSSTDFELDPSSPSAATNLPASSSLEDYMLENSDGDVVKDPFMLSRQPISQLTPLAPAIYDLQHAFNQSDHPVNNDVYKECRPKHVIMMTDGAPLPESTEGSGCYDFGGEGLSGNFKINPNKYDYACTEEHIDRFVTGDQGGNYMVNSSGQPDPKYDPRVHVVGLNIGGDARNEVVHKLASMARAGKTCAGYYLRDADGEGDWIPDQDGNCRRDDHPCLVPQPENYEFVSFKNPDDSATCEYPALILQCNGDGRSRSAMTQQELADYQECRSGGYFATASQQIFNEILRSSGLASRTRPAITNRLDDPGLERGGQYRFYSGVRIDGTNPYWRGVMFRERRLCTQGGTGVQAPGSADNPCESDDYECVHEQVNAQVTSRDSDGLASEDNRRVFTSIPTPEVYDYATKTGLPIGNNNSCGFFHTTYQLASSGSYGEFQRSYLEASSSNKDALVNNHRVPLAVEPLSEALVGSSTTSTDTPLTGDVGTALTDFFQLGGSSTETESELLGRVQSLFDEVRGRIEQKKDRVLGGILNSNPITVEPPSDDVPIESYRAYKARFADRPTMAYFSTVDGQLHAVHTGELDGGNQQIMVRDGVTPDSIGENVADSESTGAADDQREAWSYVPNMLLDKLSSFQGQNPNLMDGSPVVKDVRLCHSDKKYNQNFQACRVFCSSSESMTGLCSSGSTGGSGTCVPPEMQWRTVLVQGLGDDGSGYFAMDVTRPGGAYPNDSGDLQTKAPDPLPLWEFNPNWERGQVSHMLSSGFTQSGESLVLPPSGEYDQLPSSASTDCSDDISSSDFYWSLPFMGRSVGDPAVGTVVMPGYGDESDIRRPVVVFSGGTSYQRGSGCAGQAGSGRAIYVIDLQTGSLIRRFLGYNNGSGWQPFETSIVGTPALYDNGTGSLVTRGFVGDADGKMFRIDFGSSNPSEWEVSLFADPANPANVGPLSDNTNLGAASSKPAVALGENDNLVVVYGLGDVTDTVKANEEHMMIAVRETTSSIEGSGSTTQGDILWHLDSDNQFLESEKITGEPVIFNRGVYFTSYYRSNQEYCSTGRSRIWGLQFDSGSAGGGVPAGVYDCSSGTQLGDLDNCSARYFEPKDDVLIRGLTITLGPSCTVEGSDRASASIREQDNRKPTLIAQTGGADPGSSIEGGSSPSSGSTAGDFIKKLEVGLDAPRSETIPMSWTVISQ